MKALGIDIGGTKIYAALVNQAGEIISEIYKTSTPKTLLEIEEKLKEVIASFKDFEIVAIATAGAVNLENSRVIGSTGNLAQGYPNLDFSKLSNKKVFVENDANAAAWAEYAIGASKNTAVSLMVTLGTGVGGGIIINDKLFKGKDGTAGEMHFKIERNRSRYCTCGSFDCFEAYASGGGLAKTAQEIAQNPSLTSYDVIEGVQNSDPAMLKAFETWQNDIKYGLLGLTNLFNPDCIVISGSMGKFVNTEKIEKEINEKSVATHVEIKKALLDNHAGLIGACLLAFKDIV